MESAADSIGVQSLNDIENYLVNFNKEIAEDVEDEGYMITPSGSGSLENGGNLYTDPSAIYSSASETSVKMGSSGVPSKTSVATCFDLDSGADGLAPDLLALQGAPVGVATRVMEDGLDDEELMDQSTTEQEKQANGDNDYHTVTIVPSEVNQGGEVSYVLIVSQNDGKSDEADADLSIYDFKEEKPTVDSSALDEDDDHARKPGRSSSVSVFRKLAYFIHCLT